MLLTWIGPGPEKTGQMAVKASYEYWVFVPVQLKRAKTLCAKRMQYLGGSEYSCYVDSNEVPLEKKVCVLLIVIHCMLTRIS